MVIVNGKNHPNELIRNANGWVKKYSSPDGHASAFRPNCDDGFLSVSDIYCCGNNTDCLNYLPNTVPCIAFQCLSDCGRYSFFDNTNISMITFGNGVLGNDFHYYGYTFVRFIQNFTMSPSEWKCLNFNCLTFL